MYPQVDLDILSRRKAGLVGRVRARREACAEEAVRVLRPVVWAGHAYAQWKAISPFMKIAAVPLGLLLKRKLFPRSGGVVGGLFRWAPLALNLFRSMR